MKRIIMLLLLAVSLMSVATASAVVCFSGCADECDETYLACEEPPGTGPLECLQEWMDCRDSCDPQ